MFRRKLHRIVFLLSFILLPLLASAAQYTIADMAGTWENNGLASGRGAPWWIRGPITFNANGTWFSRLTEYPSDADNGSGTFTISEDGSVVISWPDLPQANYMHCNMDLNKTFMVCTQTWEEDVLTTQNAIMIKKGSSYTLADLAGTWGG